MVVTMARRVSTTKKLSSVVILGLVLGVVVAVLYAASTYLPQSVRENVLGAPVSVPVEYASVIKEASARCPVVPLNVFAAQLHAESGWDPNAKSPAGARGIAQFMPKVWKQYAIDGDGDGEIDVWNPIDAIHSAAELNCLNRKLVSGVSGKRIQNILAAYNAGFGAVRKYDGIPPYPETENYVRKILENSSTLQWP
jgi:soluble lytic murein transglycosylase-like protein